MFPTKPGPLSHASRDARAQRYSTTIHLNADGRHFAPPPEKRKNRTIEDRRQTTRSRSENGVTQHGKHLAGLNWTQPKQGGRERESEGAREQGLRQGAWVII